ncbi:hypothetical protein OROHE_023422 [Orobanche hederae]
MGWLSKIFKRSSNHKVSNGQYDCSYGTHTIDNNPSTSWSSLSETGDMNRAIKFSLSEEDPNGKDVTGREPRYKDDELLVRDLGERLNVESRPESWSGSENVNEYGFGYGYGYGYGYDNLYQPITFPYSTGFRFCAACNMKIGTGRFLSCLNDVWHPECFRCCACNQPISDHEITTTSYSPTIYNILEKFGDVIVKPKMDVLKNLFPCLGAIHTIKLATRRLIIRNVISANTFIPTNADGFIEYKAHPFWSQKYCPIHERDKTPRCCSCERMKPWDKNFGTLADGRNLCLECQDSAIMGTNESQPLLIDIQEFFKGLGMEVAQKLPLVLVEKQALNKAMSGERHEPETRGVCLSEEHTVPSRRPRTGAGNRVRTELQYEVKVTAILILYGLPRLLTGTILAHEMMHAWFRLNDDFRNLGQEVEEGMCQVIACMWLESQIKSMSDGNNASNSPGWKKPTRSPFEDKLGGFYKNQIETDTSKVYGDGFRAGRLAVAKFGLRRTLVHIRETQNFPY